MALHGNKHLLNEATVTYSIRMLILATLSSSSIIIIIIIIIHPWS
jgi:hypothetical protein